jgi:hypothetical protein
MVRAFKADVTRRARVELGWTEGIWEHNYYDRVIRDDREFSNALQYIAENPLRWQARALESRPNGMNKAKDRHSKLRHYKEGTTGRGNGTN